MRKLTRRKLYGYGYVNTNSGWGSISWYENMQHWERKEKYINIRGYEQSKSRIKIVHFRVRMLKIKTKYYNKFTNKLMVVFEK